MLRAGRDSVAEEPRPEQPGEGLARSLVSFLAFFGRGSLITPIPIETGLWPLFFTLGRQPAIQVGQRHASGWKVFCQVGLFALSFLLRGACFVGVRLPADD